jgi:hypothetical protein
VGRGRDCRCVVLVGLQVATVEGAAVDQHAGQVAHQPQARLVLVLFREDDGKEGLYRVELLDAVEVVEVRALDANLGKEPVGDDVEEEEAIGRIGARPGRRALE